MTGKRRKINTAGTAGFLPTAGTANSGRSTPLSTPTGKGKPVSGNLKATPIKQISSLGAAAASSISRSAGPPAPAPLTSNNSLPLPLTLAGAAALLAPPPDHLSADLSSGQPSASSASSSTSASIASSSNSSLRDLAGGISAGMHSQRLAALQAARARRGLGGFNNEKQASPTISTPDNGTTSLGGNAEGTGAFNWADVRPLRGLDDPRPDDDRPRVRHDQPDREKMPLERDVEDNDEQETTPSIFSLEFGGGFSSSAHHSNHAIYQPLAFRTARGKKPVQTQKKPTRLQEELRKLQEKHKKEQEKLAAEEKRRVEMIDDSVALGANLQDGQTINDVYVALEKKMTRKGFGQGLQNGSDGGIPSCQTFGRNVQRFETIRNRMIDRGLVQEETSYNLTVSDMYEDDQAYVRGTKRGSIAPNIQEEMVEYLLSRDETGSNVPTTSFARSVFVAMQKTALQRGETAIGLKPPSKSFLEKLISAIEKKHNVSRVVPQKRTMARGEADSDYRCAYSTAFGTLKTRFNFDVYNICVGTHCLLRPCWSRCTSKQTEPTCIRSSSQIST